MRIFLVPYRFGQSPDTPFTEAQYNAQMWVKQACCRAWSTEAHVVHMFYVL